MRDLSALVHAGLKSRNHSSYFILVHALKGAAIAGIKKSANTKKGYTKRNEATKVMRMKLAVMKDSKEGRCTEWL